MPLRTLIAAAVIVSCACPAAAEWHAVAAPPRAGLPAVEVDLGYPDGFVSISSSPIRLRARTADRPFDGYIGFRLQVGGIKTIDNPVLSRAVLRPRSEWSVATWIRVSQIGDRAFENRELVVVWRDRNLKAIAVQAVGRPVWSSPRPLRIAGAGEAVPDATYLGTPAVVLPPSALSDQPRWYAGFSSIVVPTAVWLTLPDPVRNAIFRAPLRVHFFGAPPAEARLSTIDGALLPIERKGTAWRAKDGANFLGSREAPSLAVSEVAVFAAREDDLRTAVPTFARRREGLYEEPLVLRKSPLRPAEILREYRALVVFVAVALTIVFAWFLLRRGSWRTTFLAAPALVAAALLLMGSREWIRPATGTHLYTERRLAAPGVVAVMSVLYDYGPAPHSVAASMLPAFEGSITGADSVHAAEVRGEDTLPGTGTLLGEQWRTFVRYASHREAGTPAVIRIVSKTDREMVVDFEADRRIDYVAARWTTNGMQRQGETRVGSRSRGRVTIRDREELSNMLWEVVWRSADIAGRLSARSSLGDLPFGGVTRVTLFDVERDRTILLAHVEPAEEVAPASPYQILSRLNPGPAGIRVTSMVLPRPVPGNARVLLRLSQTDWRDLLKLSVLTLEGEGGIATLDLRALRESSAEVPASELRRIAPNGGVIRLSIDPKNTDADLSRTTVLLTITEGNS